MLSLAIAESDDLMLYYLRATIHETKHNTQLAINDYTYSSNKQSSF